MRAQAPRGVASGEVLEREWWGVVGQGPSALGEWKYRRVSHPAAWPHGGGALGLQACERRLAVEQFGLDDVNVVNGSSCNGVSWVYGSANNSVRVMNGPVYNDLRVMNGSAEQQREGGERFYEQQHARGDGQACVQQRVRGGERVGGGRDVDDQEGVPRRCDGSKCVDHHPEKVRDQQAD
eukprot:CAMPEP_0185566988 /NCGR_PEP_ID=MMETSP0434-20130131/397_1 /TAXON_ID=626734 ORGANISM="Favella taraikaensis, Strain Fe Narragansett Bay" /NCGR_SAMPLE_ID=MMETSP0434 /ASSEMBLY_ACC=CAM_ASM_000379 /LENGTH=179 /DNA_ID=CAMNT_0028181085 /DNA_START=274 /DNA_END=813 /DNA_ORIENTATION=-